MQRLIRQHEFIRELREFMEQPDLPDEVKEVAGRVEMELASPGDWEAARHEVVEAPETTE